MIPLNFYLEGRNLSDVWYRGLKLIMEKGFSYHSRERGTFVYEVLNLVSYVRYVGEMYPEEARPKLLHEYKDSLLNDEKKGFVYTYGDRLNNWDNRGINQIESVVERLENTRDTRRAVAVTWIPDVDGKRSEVPCMIAVDFKLREKLYLTAYFRSNDFYGAFVYNVVALSNLQNYVADKLSVDSAGVTLFSTSSHIYAFDKDAVVDILKKHRYSIGK